ncbi:MAG: TonB-dependent receptor [Novosphingobium sp.]
MTKEPGRSKPEGLASSPSAMLALGCIGLIASTSPVLAQDRSEPEQRLGGVTVTDTAIDESYNRTETASDKSTAPLLNTPQTISVIPQEVIRDRAARTLADVLRNTPGISFNAGENGFGTSTNNFTLRGFDSSGNVFVDNARDSGSYARDIFNVESVEVVKGAAADNGRGSAGGYVNINTKKPSLDGFVAGDLSFGFDQYDSKSRKRGTIDINQPIGGTAAVRLNAVVEDSGVPGRDLAKNKFWGIAPSVAVGLGTSFRAILSWEHLERDDRPDWGVPGATVRKLVTYNPATAGAPRDAFYGLRSDFDDTTADSILGRLEYDLSSAVTISNQTRWSRIKRASRFTNPTGFTPATLSVPTGTVFYDRVNKSISNITNLSARFDTGGISHNLALGVEFTSEKSNADRLGAAVPAPGSTSLFDPDPIRVGAAPFNATQTARIKVDTLSFYLYDTIEFSEQFQITGGIRGENYEVEIDSLTAAGLPTGAADSFKRDKFSFSGKVGLVFKPVEAGSFYASFGTSTLPPGSYLSNPDISRTGDNAFPGFVPNAKQVRSHNYEIGLKWDFFDGTLSTTAALFRTEKRNVPTLGRTQQELDDGVSAYLAGTHKQIVQGVELGIAGSVTPAWNIFGGVLIMDSKRKISDTLDRLLYFGNTGDRPGEWANVTVDGDRLAFTPNFSATLWTTYRLPFGLTIGGGVQHQGSSYLGRPDDANRVIPNGRFGKLPGYTLFNGMLAYDITENIDVRLNVDNIANKKYAVSTNWPGSRATLGAPRTWLVSAGFRF